VLIFITEWNTAVYYAVEEGHIELVELLLSFGAINPVLSTVSSRRHRLI